MKIKDFMTQDHDRLDRILRDFSRIRNQDFAQAEALFHEFKIGLQRHMAWEEEILFPFIERRTGMQAPGPSALAQRQHQEIKALLEKIETQIGGKESGTGESELIDLLVLHNREEERVLYPWIDVSLDEEERQEALDQMKHFPADRNRR